MSDYGAMYFYGRIDYSSPSNGDLIYLMHGLGRVKLWQGSVGVEDVTSHLLPHLSLHSTLRTCSSDTILRAISELAVGNTTYTSDTGRSYDFNTATMLNSLLVKALLSTGQLVAGESYDLDFDHQFIETEKYDGKGILGGDNT